ncbi:DUF2382 domain-containing protein [uncultured Jatrophihabitans sp.]|uniref:DUF2382 domain-containing protein n=1 Tax=uncultured Jatrophihabitans sp. TaxID=1610747 RepID=UPI0035CA09C2
MTDPRDSESDPSVLLSAEQLLTTTKWVESGHVRVRRRVVSEMRTIDVEVRREELVIEVRDAAPGTVGESYRGTVLDGPAVQHPVTPAAEPLVLLLREEAPEVVMHRNVYERVTVDVVTVQEATVWRDTVRHEEAVTSTSPTT